MRSFRQPIAIHANGFGLFSRPSCADRFATDCQRLRPRGSIKAPSSVGHKEIRLARIATTSSAPLRGRADQPGAAERTATRARLRLGADRSRRTGERSIHSRSCPAGCKRSRRPTPLTYEVHGMRQLLLGVTQGGTLWVDFAVLAAFLCALAAAAARAYPRAIL